MEPAINFDQVTVHEQTSFAISDGRGDMLPGGTHGFFVADTRHLSGLVVTLGGKRLERLSSDVPHHDTAAFHLANPPVRRLPAQTLAVTRERRVGAALVERIAVTSYAQRPVTLQLEIALAADFADIFEVRGRRRLTREVHVEARTRSVRFSYSRPGYRRVTVVEADGAGLAPRIHADGRMSFALELEHGVPWQVTVRVTGGVASGNRVMPLPTGRPADAEWIEAWVDRLPRLETEDRRLAAAWPQAIRDLRALLLAEPGGWFIPAAGMPWFIAVFGRDSAITALQSLLTGMEIAYGTLGQLAAYQGRVIDRFREEEPGRIAHEIRRGELATLEHVPHGRYYGSVDATPLFVMLFAEACRWSGWLSTQAPATGAPPKASANGPMPRVLRNLLPAVERALEWIDRFATRLDGLVWYQRLDPRGARNQVWKDSEDSYRFADGRLAQTPIAAIEVQGYVIAAKRGMADVLEAMGRRQRPRSLRAEADRLAQLVDEAFWMPREGFFATGLDRFGRQIDSITSNPGHLLWCAALSDERARQVADRLLAADMFSGWGIRTLSSAMRAYNPLSYHNGSVWPHDNSLIAAGMARYGLGDRAWAVIDAQLDAVQASPDRRLPELLGGFERDGSRGVVPYPAACAPQAWCSGAVLLAVQTALGVRPSHAGPLLASMAQAPPMRLEGVRVGGWRGSLGNREPPRAE